MFSGVSVVDLDAVVRQEAARWYYAEFEDRCQDGWVILLEEAPDAPPALVRSVLRRRLANRSRDANTRKRGRGFAVGRLDAGWADDAAFAHDPTREIVNQIAAREVLRALNFVSFSASRQAIHQAISRAKTRWARLRKPFDPVP